MIGRQEGLVNILKNLNLFYNDLNKIILAYEMRNEWEASASNTLYLNSNPSSLTTDQQYLYVCIANQNSLIKYNLQGEMIEKYTSLDYPQAIDIDNKTNLFYVANMENVVVLNKTLSLVSSWKLPAYNDSVYRAIKVDGDVLYLTIYRLHQIFKCQCHDGKVINKFGDSKFSLSQGKFNFPDGMTINKNYLYVCDSSNHRVQVLNKENGKFVTEWKSLFNLPYTIFFDELERLFYIGDHRRVSVYTPEGQCVQQIGDLSPGNSMSQFNVINGIVRISDLLYVSDCNNLRIQIFGPKKE